MAEQCSAGGWVLNAWRLSLGEDGFWFSDFPMLPGYPSIPELISAHQGQTSLQDASALTIDFPDCCHP